MSESEEIRKCDYCGSENTFPSCVDHEIKFYGCNDCGLITKADETDEIEEFSKKLLEKLEDLKCDNGDWAIAYREDLITVKWVEEAIKELLEETPA